MLELVSHSDQSQLFLSFYKDIQFAIRRFKTRHLIFVIKTKNYNIVLRLFFLNFIIFH